VPHSLEVSSYTATYFWEFPGATYANTHMGDGTFWSHIGQQTINWTPEATNNTSTYLTWQFQIDDPASFVMMTYEEQTVFLENASNFDLVISTNVIASSPPVSLEYRNTRYVDPIVTEDTIETNLRLLTKGYTNSEASSVFKITVTAQSIERDYTGAETGYVDIPPEEIQIFGQTLNSNGVIYKVLQDNTTHDATPRDQHHYIFQLRVYCFR